MKLNTDKVLIKISNLTDRLKKVHEFKEIHEETLNLCRMVYDRKADYKKIDIPYPRKLIIIHKTFKDNEKDQITDGNPNRKTLVSELKKDTYSVLKKLERYLQLKKSLE